MPEGAVKLDMQGTVGGREVQRQRRIERERERKAKRGRNGNLGEKREEGEIDTQRTFSVKYSSPQHHRSSSAPGHNKLCTVTMVTGQIECYQCHS